MSQSLPAIFDVQGKGLQAYLNSVNAQPFLTEQQERELAVRYREEDDLDAAQQLVLSHLRYVVRVAKGFLGYGLPLSDLVQEGNIGLMKAVKRYEPDRNVRLVSFAVHWIKAEIFDFILKNWKLVRVATTKAQRKMFFNLRKNRPGLDAMSESEIQKLSEDLDISADTVREMETRMTGAVVSFDADPEEQEQTASFAPSGYIEDYTFNPERVYEIQETETAVKDSISEALLELDDRARDIIERRWLTESKKATLHQLAKEYGVSAERIRQIEARALEKMKPIIESSGFMSM